MSRSARRPTSSATRWATPPESSSAAGGEVVVSHLLHDMLEQTGEVEFGEPREVQLKGIDGPQMVFPLAVP